MTNPASLPGTALTRLTFPNVHARRTRPRKASTSFVADVIARFNDWESWNGLITYIMMIPTWLWYCLRSGSAWFFSTANPTLTFGGFTGDSKKEMYDQLPPGSFPKSFFAKSEFTFPQVKTMLQRRAFKFPLEVKPDVGQKGYLFRKIYSESELFCYHKKVKINYIIQEFVDYPIEVSVFYYRVPNQKKGKITGFVRKDYLQVVGNGRSTLRELIKQHDGVHVFQEEILTKHATRLNDIIPVNQVYVLSQGLNSNRGGKLVNLEHLKDEQLLKRFDELSLYTRYFYYGRFDIKCASIDDLKKGKNFTILDFNGAGAEPNHIYGNGYSFKEAIRTLVDHCTILFEISKHNRQLGIRRAKLWEGIMHMQKTNKHMAYLKKLDADPTLLSAR